MTGPPRLPLVATAVGLSLGCAGLRAPPGVEAPTSPSPSTAPGDGSRQDGPAPFEFSGQGGVEFVTDRNGVWVEMDLATSTCLWVSGPEDDAERMLHRCVEVGRVGPTTRIRWVGGPDNQPPELVVSATWFRDLPEAEQLRRLDDDVGGTYAGPAREEYLAELRASCMVIEPMGTFCTCDPSCPQP